MKNPGPDQLLSLIEAAKYFGQLAGRKAPHEATVRRWVTRGVRGARLRHIRYGNQILIRAGDVAAWMHRCDEPAAPRAATVRHDPQEPQRPGHDRSMAILAEAGLAPEGGAE